MVNNKSSSYRWVVLFIMSIGVFGPNYTQFQLSPLAPQIMATFGLTNTEFSSVFTSPMIPAIIFSLIAGLLVDKYGAKKIIAMALLVTAVGTIWRIWTGSYLTLFISMFLTGVGITFLNANGPKIIGSWFPPEKVGTMMGIFLSTATLGMTLGMGTTAMLPSIKSAYTIAAVISVVALLLWVFLMKSPPTTEGNQENSSEGILDSLKICFKSRNVWITGFALLFLFGLNLSISSFLPTALGERGVDPVAAGVYASMVTFGNLTGCLIMPILAAKLGRNKPIILSMALVGALGGAFAWLAPVGLLLYGALFITGLAIGSLIPLLVSIPIQLPEIGPRYAGTAGGVVSTLQLLGAVTIPTYVAAPIAGDNFYLFFIIGGISALLTFLLSLALPEVGRKGA